MRSVVLIVATVILLGSAVALYTWMQPPAARKTARAITASNKQRPQLERTMRGVGSGERPWLKRTDPKTGEVTSQMRAEVWDPQRDNSVNLAHPQAEFFSSDGRQRILIDGTDGNILMPPSPENKAAKFTDPGPTAMPSRGKLHNVTVSIFEPVDAKEPQLVASMNNAAFDTDLFRITTEAFTDEHGNEIAADRVPVIVRGIDYDFDGEGLIIRWNERDRKLELLEVAHGKSLVIKNPNALSTQPISRATPQQSEAVLREAPLRDSLASVDPSAHRLILTASKTKRPPTKSQIARRRHPTTTTAPTTGPTTKKVIRDLSPVIYRATFDQDVRVFRANSQHPDEPVATGDQMNIYLLQVPDKSATTQASMASNNPSSNPPSKPSSRPTTKSSTKPSTRAARSRARTTQASTQSTTEPATEKAGPVTVRWVGKLRVVPVERAPDAHLEPGKAIIHLTGAPTRLDERGMKAKCGEAVFNAADNSALLLPSAEVPKVIMNSDEGWTVTTPRVRYDQDPKGPRTAILTGPSTAQIPVEGQNTFMNSSWSDECKLWMNEVAGRTVMERVDLLGNVNVDHPKLALTSRELSLRFDPNGGPTTRKSSTRASTEPSSKPTTLAASRPATVSSSDSGAVTASLREIIATGDADCKIKDPQDERTIAAQVLKVQVGQSPDNQMYAKRVDADGDVRTVEKGKSMRAGHMVAGLAPTTKSTTRATTQATTQPATHATTLASSRPTTRGATSQPLGGDVKLEWLDASENVILTSDDGTGATADELHARTVNDQLSYQLVGKPLATITSTKGPNGKTSLSGPRIDYDPVANRATVVGGGTGDGTNPNSPKQTMHMTWTGDAIMDGNTNLIDVDRDVNVVTHEADGTINTATSKHLQAVLTTRPTTMASGEAGRAASTRPSSRPAQADDLTTSFMKDKEISAATLIGDVKIKSALNNPNGTLARGIDIFNTERVTYDQLSGNMVIPGPGQMLYQDYRTATRKAAATQKSDSSLGSGDGKTGFVWDKSVVYERATRLVTMTGDVRVVHWPENEAGQKFDLTGDVLTAKFEPKPTSQPATRPTTLASSRPATRSSAGPEEDLGQLKLVTATGNVHVTSERMKFDAPEMTFNPQGPIITASGDERHPIDIFDIGTGSHQMASKLYWNTQTDEIHIEKMIGRIQRQ